MIKEGRQILQAFERMQQAMVDKDIETMRALVTEDKTFTHMSSKVQTREEYFAEIADGTLNYYKYVIRNPQIRVDGDRAILKANVTLTARVYGISGSWTLATKTNYIRVQDAWIQCN